MEASRKRFLASVDRGMVVKQSTIEGAGKGAFWMGRVPLPANKTVGVYAGKHLTEAQSEAAIADSSNGGVYIFRGDDGLIIDGIDRTHWSAFANDGAPCSVRNNMRFNGKGHLITMRKIMPGDEVLVYYGESYWSS